MQLVHYNPKTYEILGYIDPTMGIFDDDGTAYFSVSDEMYAQYSTAKAWTDGKIITHIAPPNDFAVLTADGWTIDEQLAQQAVQLAKTQAKNAINDAVVAIYDKYTPLLQEFSLREEQAIAYADNDYDGEVPCQVEAFATAAGLPAKQATDIIIDQASKLNAGLEKLAELRMQKFAVNNMTNIDDIHAHRDSVLQHIATIAEVL